MLELEAVLAALRAYRDRCKGQPLKVAAVNRYIGIVRGLTWLPPRKSPHQRAG